MKLMKSYRLDYAGIMFLDDPMRHKTSIIKLISLCNKVLSKQLQLLVYFHPRFFFNLHFSLVCSFCYHFKSTHTLTT